jgi:uncharacterized protein (TIGR00251 family)
VVREATNGVLVDIRVIPRASKAGVAGTRDNALLVRLNAPPVEGAANAELVELIAKLVGVPRRNVAVVAGERSRQKRVLVAGSSVEQVRKALAT